MQSCVLSFVQGGREQVQTLISLVPGELLQLQMRIQIIKYGLDETSGHWSHWSQTVAGMVPQSAGVSGGLESFVYCMFCMDCVDKIVSKTWSENNTLSCVGSHPYTLHNDGFGSFFFR